MVIRYSMKVISETRSAHYIRYIHFIIQMMGILEGNLIATG